jgi:transposase InsO family protein
MRTKDKPTLSAWANFRFSVVGPLLSAPPDKGQLRREIERLAQKHYRHPIEENKQIRLGASTIERWYYKALRSQDPVRALGRKPRSDINRQTAMSRRLIEILARQYRDNPAWSCQLHVDNLAALVSKAPDLGPMPSYSTVLRRMKERGWVKSSNAAGAGRKRAAERLEACEVRSYESEYVHALWHLDFHTGSRVVDVNGSWQKAHALCILDDRSRLCCHIQWYLGETAEVLIHGLMQAFDKRGLPRALMSDNGSAMIAEETRQGLMRLGIVHKTTLAYSPYQNGKQESFWGRLEGRLLAMLNRVKPLTLRFLNDATQAWAELEYNRNLHHEIATSPLQRMLEGPDVSRPAPESRRMHLAFTARESRVQRKSDGTIQLKGVRFELPSRMRHFGRVHVRFQSWDLSRAWVIDPRTDEAICPIYPLDKIKNSDGKRRSLNPPSPKPQGDSDPIPPLLSSLLAEYAATGLPPAYIPKEEVDHDQR